MNDAAIWIALLALCLSCYFAACSIALRTFSRARLTDLLEARGKAHLVDAFVEQSEVLSLVAGMLRTVCNLIVLLSVLYHFEWTYSDWHHLWHYAAALATAGVLVSVFGVGVPGSLARYQPEALLARSIGPLRALLWLLKPLVRCLHLFDPIIRRVTGAVESDNPEEDLSEEVMSVVEDHEQTANVDEAQKAMIEAVFELRSTDVGEVMTPRTDIEAIEVAASLQEVRDTVLRIGHSRIPVCEDNLDHIVGVLYAKDLIALLGVGHEGPFNLRKLVREAWLVPETKPVRELLAEFKDRKVHIAIVVDEYGGTAGLVTIEDVLEEIVGDIRDEYEPPEEQAPTIHRVDERTAEVDARVSVSDLNDELDLELPEDEDYDTVGGFVFSTLGHIPRVGEEIELDNMRLTVTDAERTKVNRVRVELLTTIAGEGK